jgi:hypothetical protein
MIEKEEHLVDSGLREILAIKAVFPTGLNANIKKVFPNVIPIDVPEFIPNSYGLNGH